MKKIKILLVLGLSLALLACQGKEDQKNEIDKNQSQTTNDNGLIVVSSDLQEFIDQDLHSTLDKPGDLSFIEDLAKVGEMDTEEKNQAYEKMNQVGKVEDTNLYKTIESDYEDVFYHINVERPAGGVQNLVEEESFKRPIAFYINFYECPYCQAFSPKLAKFASDYDLEVHSFNRRQNASQEDINYIVDVFNPSTVPVLYLVYEGQILGILDESTSSQAMEYFFDYMKSLQTGNIG